MKAVKNGEFAGLPRGRAGSIQGTVIGEAGPGNRKITAGCCFAGAVE